MSKKAFVLVILFVPRTKVIYLPKVVTIHNQLNLIQATERCISTANIIWPSNFKGILPYSFIFMAEIPRYPSCMPMPGSNCICGQRTILCELRMCVCVCVSMRIIVQLMPF